MLEDRPYMRQTPFRARRSVTLLLLLINVVAFLTQLTLRYYSSFNTDYYFALSLEGLHRGWVWQLLTFQLMHAGWLHLIVNCWVIFVFGRELEEALGWRRFLILYFGSGVVGGAIQALAGLAFPLRFGAPVVGASAGAFGLVAAFATFYPERPLMLLLFFIIPLNMRAKFLLLFSALVAIFGLVFPTDNVAHAAHLGGMLAGILFARYAVHWNWRWPQLNKKRSTSTRKLVRVSSSSSAAWGRSKNIPTEEMPPEEFLAKEVDPILDKISAHGIQSLTERERRILEAAREKMPKR